tara:strand:- start:1211 stop:3127 length:1917 start_codon:yes stop_codon:yes gene_type:complete
MTSYVEGEDAAFDIARQFTTLNLEVFPVKGKIPLTQRGFKDASKDLEQLERWHAEFPNCNWGVRTGKLVVVDVDVSRQHEDGTVTPNGYDTLEDLEGRYGSLPETVVVHTGGGGRHHYYRVKEPISSGKLADSIDFKADGGYVVLPESIHPNTGKPYLFEEGYRLGDIPIAPLPDWVRQIVDKPIRPSLEGIELKERFLSTDKPISVGRHDYLLAYAGHIWNRGITDVEAFQTMVRKENERICKPPMPEDASEDGKAFRNILTTPWTYLWESSWQSKSKINNPAKEYIDPYAIEGESPLEAAYRRMGLLKVSDWIDKPEPPQEWIVKGLVLRGALTMVSAKMKIGKSTFCRDMAVSVATGREFISRQTTQGLVLYLALEEPSTEVERAFRKLGVTNDTEILIKLEDYEISPKFIEDLRAIVQDSQPKLVIIDTVTRVPRKKHFESGDYFASSEWLEPLLHIAHQENVALLTLYHNRKGTGRISGYDAMEAILGSTGIAGTIDNLIYLDEEDEVRSFGLIGRYGRIEPTLLDIDDETGRMSVRGLRQDEKLITLQEDILEFIRTNPDCNINQIKKEVRGNSQKIGNLVRNLVEEERIELTKEGRSTGTYRILRFQIPTLIDTESRTSEVEEEEVEEWVL